MTTYRSEPTSANTVVFGKARFVSRSGWALIDDSANIVLDGPGAQERRRLTRMLPSLEAMLRRLGPSVNDWEPHPNAQRQAHCTKALALLKTVLD